MECKCESCGQSKLITRLSDTVNELRTRQERLLEVLAILLLDHQSVDPHHSDLCDKCRIAKEAIKND